MEQKKASTKTKSKPATKLSKSKATLSVSPSAWMVWEKCALSLQNVKSSFVLERDEYAKAGTALHKAISDTLLGKNVVLENDDDAAIVRFAVETVKNASNPCPLHVETPLSSIIPVNGVTFSGIADCLFCVGETIIVIDFKTGWREVEAEGNNQLKQYAHIAADKHLAKNKDWEPKNWKGIIINARFNSVSYTGGNIEPDYLFRTAKDILDRTKQKQYKTGNHCAYCQRLSTCSKVREAIAAWIKPGAIDSITREPERLAEALRLANPQRNSLRQSKRKRSSLFIWAVQFRA